MKAALPIAWARLVEDEDDMLVEIVADRVESVCGFKPDPDMVLGFLNGTTLSRVIQTPPSQPVKPAITRPTEQIAAHQPASLPVTPAREQPPNGQSSQHGTTPHPNRMGYEMGGQFHAARNAIDVLRQIFENLSAKDPSFSERFAAEPHGKSRRYLSRERDELYRRPDLCIKHSIQLRSGWWISTNHSRDTIKTIIQLASAVAGLKYGQSLVAHLGN